MSHTLTTGKGATALNWPEAFDHLAQQSRNPLLQRYYRSGVPGADTPLGEVELLAMDLETTGLNAESDNIVSIGIMPFTLKRIQCGKALYWVIKPPSELSSESVVFHHITHADIHGAPQLSEVMGQLLAAMAGKVMVVHYRSIERHFLDRALRRQIGEGLQFPVIDTMQLEARLHRKARGWIDRLLRRQPVSIRLADSRARYHLPQYHAHHALTDALATAELLHAQIATHYDPSIPLGEVWN
ncbi:3'-5' exonuclease [Pseudomonas syringae]|uniref:3'-5' exonuclease n=1 Tax=Pseudomonas syringae TaxID=317 RepID=UPI001F219EEB|nr:3'-5' exonuclease [Pseudomonas syringae]MCF5706896.1 3'-5' exonuclease [Pseudomonas syringae]